MDNTPFRPKTRNNYYRGGNDKKGLALAKINPWGFTSARVSSPERRITVSLKKKTHKTEKNMKTKILTSLVGTTLALAVAFAVWSPTNTAAQIKGAQLLMSQPTPVASVAAAPAMACAKCTTQYTSSVDTTARGAIKPVAIAAKHLCPTCDTSSKTVGVGKAATTVTSHDCTMGATKTAACCN
jgi:hypothetical protein